MNTKNLIDLNEFCKSHKIEISFISSLQQTGMIDITTIKETGFIDSLQLEKLEKIVRLYNELDINFEGIDTITHLLQRVIALQDEIIALRNRLNLYEP
ncbi:MAG: MerR family transcriptional regulator [Bacteroidetes bacterium GWF2_38_335]|nr:MAG: MerR family transcriptional regulator [Bacteroidetes bacterium GWF2_38_335]OFY78951.1 MAG: MerR family transcriptional regulator [Bacteroidetes bacterium RIFOXYA12_FULL_38_20]HBS86018.1 MerR family transcriptional regulator [Bacteroidales bacterium]